MELRHLKYFAAVAEELHFRKAAEKLFIAQPALSRQIKQLEEEIGVTLFKRTRRSVALTEPGAFLYRETQDIFNRIERFTMEARQREAGIAGKVRIGYVASAMHNVLPGIIHRLQEDFPGIQLELYQNTALAQYEMLKAEKLDIGFLRVPRQDEAINTSTIYTETYSLVVPHDHELNESNYRGLSQLANQKFILTPRNVGEKYFDNIISLFSNEGFSPVVVHESVNEHATIKLVENNIGISIIPSSFKDGFNTTVRFIELNNIPDRLQLAVAWRKKNNTPALAGMIDIITSHASGNKKRNTRSKKQNG